MSSLADYIRWLGRFSFRELPFSEADALVMCVMSYFDLGPVLREREGLPVTAADCGPALAEGSVTLKITGGESGNDEIFREAIASRRFGALVVTDYEDLLEPETPLQFAAVTFRWEGCAFLAFRGTDETIPGWREDFMISFAETEAQRLAAAYAARVVGRNERLRYYLGGHSKGGNEALFAACRLEPEAIERVERVYLLDSPGLCPEVMDTSAAARLDPKLTCILPEFSVVGKLFAPAVTDTRIVRSSASGILQHSLASWQIAYGALDTVAENDRRSVVLMELLGRWIAGLSQQERRRVTDELFDALSADGAVRLSEIADGGPRSFEAVLVRMLHAGGEETRRLMLELPAQALAALRRLRERGETPRETTENEEHL